jgi:hypothetical protein
MYCAEGQVKRNRKPQVDLVAPGVLGSVSLLFSDVDVRRLHHRGERHRHLRHRGERHRHLRHYSAERYRHYHAGH